MSIEQEADDYARRNIGGMQPVETVGDKVRAAYIAGASRPVTDERADAAQIAFHEFVFGPDEPLTARDIGITRQAWKVALEAARAVGA